jgi:hypothetical protein
MTTPAELGQVRDRVRARYAQAASTAAAFQAGFVDLLRGFAATAIAQHELPAGDDPDQLAFELNGIILAADANFVLHDDSAVLDLARQVVHRRLGLGSNAGRR